MPTALVLSPHLDDAVFSCGGTMAQLADSGWRVCMATAFTRSIHPARGFALACQLDKHLSPEVDYMALRRDEDRAAGSILGLHDVRWLDLPEAPHRGYGSAPALFGAMLESDRIWRPLSALIAGLLEELQPDLVLAPQGLGNHVDHRQMVRALLQEVGDTAATFYRDTPYAMKNPGALPPETLPALPPHVVTIASGLARKVEAACAYGSQIGYQFGGPEPAAAALRSFAEREGAGVASECFLGIIPA